MSEIIPAILPENAQDLVEKLSQIPLEVSIVHLDVLETDVWIPMNKDFETHLMVEYPEELIERWIDRGARRVIVHKIPSKLLEWRSKVEIGLGVEMNVSLEDAFKNIPNFDFVHIMSIAEIGEQGHPLDEHVFDRIREVRNKFPNVTISVDGGINEKNYQILREMGVKRLVVGSQFKNLWTFLTKK
ncbi:MAG: hypothetical protein AAB660_00170 [Patescibacteria group bacterium]